MYKQPQTFYLTTHNQKRKKETTTGHIVIMGVLFSGGISFSSPTHFYLRNMSRIEFQIFLLPRQPENKQELDDHDVTFDESIGSPTDYFDCDGLVGLTEPSIHTKLITHTHGRSIAFINYHHTFGSTKREKSPNSVNQPRKKTTPRRDTSLGEPDTF